MPQQRHPELIAKARNQFIQRRLAAVIHDDHFEAVSGIVQASEGLKTSSQVLRAAIGRDND